MVMKYTLSQYVHDGLRLKLIQAEITQLRDYSGTYKWVAVRWQELYDEQLMINERMAKFEKHPNNR